MRNRGVRSTVVGIALILTGAVGTVSCTVSAQERDPATTGARLFQEHGCYGCHRIKGLGTPIGPDLTRVGAKYSERDLVRWLNDPASQKPNAHMPKLEFAPGEVGALAAFLAAQR